MKTKFTGKNTIDDLSCVRSKFSLFYDWSLVLSLIFTKTDIKHLYKAPIINHILFLDDNDGWLFNVQWPIKGSFRMSTCTVYVYVVGI